MTSSKIFDFSHLTIAERLLLAQELMESVWPPAQLMPLTDAQRHEMQRRWTAFEAGRMTVAPWDEVRQRFFHQ